MFMTVFLTTGISSIRNSINGSIFKYSMQKCSLQGHSILHCSKNTFKFFGTVKPSKLLSSRIKQSYPILVTKFKVKPLQTQVLNLQTNAKETTKILNNVFLYKHDETTMYTLLKIFALVQCITFWTVSSNLYSVYRGDIFKEHEDWKARLTETIIPVTAISFLIIAGPTILFLLWFMSSRIVKYVILNRGGTKVTLVTYHPLKSKSSITVPLEQVRSTSSRMENKGYLPVKIKGTFWHYVLDRRGEFPNPKLFDTTVGVNRGA